jgi:SAM-dependent methyltransferase
LERHRFLATVLAAVGQEHQAAGLVLEVAPTAAVTRLLRRSDGIYLGMDVDPAADRRRVDLVADLCRMPLATGTVDLAVVFHVFEHIPDDTAAMAELARVLAGGGLALIQVPWRPHHATDEDPTAPEAERIRRFGQADHVRFYGADFEDRLHRSGLATIRIRPDDLLPDDLVVAMGLSDPTPVWLATAGDGPAPFGRREEAVIALRRRLEPDVVAGWQRLAALPPDPAPLPPWVRRLARTRVGRAIRRLAP